MLTLILRKINNQAVCYLSLYKPNTQRAKRRERVCVYVCVFVCFCFIYSNYKNCVWGFPLNNNKNHRKLAQGAYKFLWHEGQTPLHHYHLLPRHPHAVVQVKNILCRPHTSSIAEKKCDEGNYNMKCCGRCVGQMKWKWQ